MFAPDPLTVRWSTPAVPTTPSWSKLLFGPVLPDESVKSGVKWATPVPDRSFSAALSPGPVSSLPPKPNQVTSSVAGHGGEFGGGSAGRGNGDWIGRAAVIAGWF
jgi:hypothetical protein